MREGANERREETESDENASSYAERHRLRSGPFLLEGPIFFPLFLVPLSFTFEF